MDTKILKLTNGDEIITTLSGKNDTSVVTAHNPLKINSYPRVSKTGIEESMALSRWVSYGEMIVVKLSRIILLQYQLRQWVFLSFMNFVFYE